MKKVSALLFLILLLSACAHTADPPKMYTATTAPTVSAVVAMTEEAVEAEWIKLSNGMLAHKDMRIFQVTEDTEYTYGSELLEAAYAAVLATGGSAVNWEAWIQYGDIELQVTFNLIPDSRAQVTFDTLKVFGEDVHVDGIEDAALSGDASNYAQFALHRIGDGYLVKIGLNGAARIYTESDSFDVTHAVTEYSRAVYVLGRRTDGTFMYTAFSSKFGVFQDEEQILKQINDPRELAAEYGILRFDDEFRTDFVMESQIAVCDLADLEALVAEYGDGHTLSEICDRNFAASPQCIALQEDGSLTVRSRAYITPGVFWQHGAEDVSGVVQYRLPVGTTALTSRFLLPDGEYVGAGILYELPGGAEDIVLTGSSFLEHLETVAEGRFAFSAYREVPEEESYAYYVEAYRWVTDTYALRLSVSTDTLDYTLIKSVLASASFLEMPADTAQGVMDPTAPLQTVTIPIYEAETENGRPYALLSEDMPEGTYVTLQLPESWTLLDPDWKYAGDCVYAENPQPMRGVCPDRCVYQAFQGDYLRAADICTELDVPCGVTDNGYAYWVTETVREPYSMAEYAVRVQVSDRYIYYFDLYVDLENTKLLDTILHFLTYTEGKQIE